MTAIADRACARPTPAPPRRAPKKRPPHLRDHRTAYLMITPMVILLGIFVMWPLVYSLYLSGFEISFYQDPEFVGFQFYQYVLDDARFWKSVGVGLAFAADGRADRHVHLAAHRELHQDAERKLAGFMKTTDLRAGRRLELIVASVLFVFIYQDEGLANWFLSLLNLGPVAWLNDPDDRAAGHRRARDLARPRHHDAHHARGPARHPQQLLRVGRAGWRGLRPAASGTSPSRS